MKFSILNLKFSKTKLTLAVFFAVFAAALNIHSALAVTNMDATDHWAWNDDRGWIDFYSPLTANLTATQLTGYGVFQDTPSDFVSFDCATSPNGNICGTSNYSVLNDGSGNLSGWAWNDGVGWISFCGGLNTANCPGSTSYQVTVNNSTGDFSGYAWNDAIGWISFNCAGPGVCGTSNYKVRTSYFGGGFSAIGYVISNTFDTGVVGGAAYNSIIWQGTLASGGGVQFQLATSNCANGATNAPTCNSGSWGSGTSGDGAYVGPGGSSVSTDVYTGAPNQALLLMPQWHNNRRYYRYKMYIGKAAGQASPVVQDVVVNWSP